MVMVTGYHWCLCVRCQDSVTRCHAGHNQLCRVSRAQPSTRLCSLHHWRWVTGPDDCITYCTALIELLAGVRPGACVCCTASHSQAAAILVFSQLVRAAAGSRTSSSRTLHTAPPSLLHTASCLQHLHPRHLQPAPAGGHWSPLAWPGCTSQAQHSPATSSSQHGTAACCCSLLTASPPRWCPPPPAPCRWWRPPVPCTWLCALCTPAAVTVPCCAR